MTPNAGTVKADVLVVFDFDCSLAEADSYAHVGSQLYPELSEKLTTQFFAGEITWPRLMDEFHTKMATDKPHVSIEDLRAAAARVPVHPRMLDAVKLAVDEYGATMKVVSDASVFYIRSFLDHNELTPRVSELVSNPAHLEDGGKTLRVRPLHGPHLAPHGCPNCPTQLCKGSVMERFLQQHRFSRVLYVGDGIGDFCPATKLSKNDVVFAREGLENGLPFELLETLKANPSKFEAQVRPWRDGADLYSHFRRFFQEEYPAIHAIAEVPTVTVPRKLPSRGSADVVVIFDYDWSLVNENSDTFVFQLLHPELLGSLRDRCAKQPSWTQVMDDMLRVLAEEKPDVTADMIRAAVAKVPIQPYMLDAVRLAVDHYGADLKIVSDANTIYIDSMLQSQGLGGYVSEVITNPAEFEPLGDGRSRLHVRPYHAATMEPHGCTWCPTNMCKGAIIDAIRSAQPYSHVMYVGDGPGDFCAATHLTKEDLVFARAIDMNGKSYGLQKRIDANPDKIQAHVVPWSTGEDIYRHFAALFHSLEQQRNA